MKAENKTCETCDYNYFCEGAGTLKLGVVNPACYMNQAEENKKLKAEIEREARDKNYRPQQRG